MEKSKRKEKEFLFRRSEILSEAEKVFAAKGFYAATMVDIAQASGYAVGTLYQFFPSKEDLFMTLIAERLACMERQIRESMEEKEDVLDKIGALIRAHFLFVESNLDFCNLFYRVNTAALYSANTTLWEKMLQDHLRQARFIEDLFRQAMAEGKIRPADAGDLAFVLIGMIRATVFAWMISNRESPLSEKTSLILNVLLHGVMVGNDMKGAIS